MQIKELNTRQLWAKKSIRFNNLTEFILDNYKRILTKLIFKKLPTSFFMIVSLGKYVNTKIQLKIFSLSDNGSSAHIERNSHRQNKYVAVYSHQ